MASNECWSHPNQISATWGRSKILNELATGFDLLPASVFLQINKETNKHPQHGQGIVFRCRHDTAQSQL